MDSKLKEKVSYFESEIASFREFASALENDVEYTEMRDFQILLAAVHSLMKGHNFTEIMLKDATGAYASKDVVSENLSENFGITNDDTAMFNIGKSFYRGLQWQFTQFAAVEEQQFQSDLEKMNPKNRAHFLGCKEFSDALTANISPKGYFGWDIALGTDLLRESLFCDYCNQPAAEKLLDDITKPLLKYCDNWVDYAVSFVAGGTYAAYKNSGFDINETKSTFDQLLKLVRRLFEDESCRVWKAFSWFKPKVYFPDLDRANLKPLCPEDRFCFVSDRITLDGAQPCYFYREDPQNHSFPDSGWRFWAGDESKEYVADTNKSSICPLNEVLNYDESLVPMMDMPIGKGFIRKPDGTFEEFKVPTAEELAKGKQ